MKNNFQFSIFNFQKGFTLIELMVSISIFIIVMMISMNSILGIFDANRKSRSLKTVMSNLNIAVETISKEMRYGSNYHCGSSGTLTTVQNCPGGDSLVSFLSSDDEQTTFRLNGTVIEKDVGSGYLPLTSPEVTIESLRFYVIGTATSDSLQPKVNILIKGYAGVGNDQSGFTIQTMVSQRKSDRP